MLFSGLGFIQKEGRKQNNSIIERKNNNKKFMKRIPNKTEEKKWSEGVA